MTAAPTSGESPARFCARGYRMLPRAVPLLALCAAIAACSGSTDHDDKGDKDNKNDKPEAASGTAPLLVDVPTGTMVEGFANGRLRRTSSINGFHITKHPITRGEYTACVAAGACTHKIEPGCQPTQDLPGFELEGNASPAVCVHHADAAAYCHFVGGRLPTMAEWWYAARGTDPQTYAWGNQASNCDRHPRSVQLVPGSKAEENGVVRTAACATIEDDGKLRVGKHPDGASPFGLDDVLITPAELLATDAKPLLPACNSAFPACTILGHAPGAIEAAAAIHEPAMDEHDKNSEATTVPIATYSFRCVVEDK